MKRLFVVVMALGLSACGSTDFYGDSVADTAPAVSTQQEAASVSVQASAAPSATPQPEAQTPPPPTQVAAALPSAHCKALARQRAMDAGFQGEDGDTQESVYNRTYSDCVAWDLKHNL